MMGFIPNQYTFLLVVIKAIPSCTLMENCDNCASVNSPTNFKHNQSNIPLFRCDFLPARTRLRNFTSSTAVVALSVVTQTQFL